MTLFPNIRGKLGWIVVVAAAADDDDVVAAADADDTHLRPFQMLLIQMTEARCPSNIGGIVFYRRVKGHDVLEQSAPIGVLHVERVSLGVNGHSFLGFSRWARVTVHSMRVVEASLEIQSQQLIVIADLLTWENRCLQWVTTCNILSRARR